MNRLFYLSNRYRYKQILLKYLPIIMSITIFIALFFVNFAAAQDVQPPFTRKDENGNYFGRELPNLRAFTLKEIWTHPRVSYLKVHLDINYPTNTGNEDLDQYFKSQLDKDYRLMTENTNPNDGSCHPDSCASAYTKLFEAFSPSPDILSLAFTFYRLPQGGASTSGRLEAHTYDLNSGAEMTLDQVFSEPKKSISLLWPMIARGWCEHRENNEKVFPNFYKIRKSSANCRRAENIPLPDQLRSPPYTFENLGFAVLTPRGLSLKFTGF
ncbi:MAG: hypothetical protein LBE80_03955 [Deltaproteobacteria bacterium]|jgi:hypothetical protein|nr:hypothetical protein [Deltaproteobacteria bacterium]